MHVLSIIGCLSSEQYHEARLIAEDIVTAAANTATPLSLHLRPLIHYQWQSYLRSHPTRSSSAPGLPSLDPCVLHSAYGRLGGIDELVQWAAKQYQYEDVRAQRSTVDARAYRSALKKLARQELADYITRQQQHSGYQYAYLDFEVDGRHTASPTPQHNRLIIELYPHIAPRAVQNFVQLTHSTPTQSLPNPAAAPADLPALHYLHSPVHRVVPGSHMQCGDVYRGRGDFSLSSYGAPLEDESFALSHEAAGVVSLVGRAGVAHSGGSQFLVTLGAARHFDGRYVGFGRVVDGLQLLAQCNNSVSVGVNGGGVAPDGLVLRYERPLYPVTVEACDQFNTELLSDSFLSWTQQLTTVIADDSTSSAATPSRAITLLVIGPHAAGKTSLVHTWCSCSPLTPPSSTTGFELDTLTYTLASAASPSSNVTYQLSLYGLGGAANIRDYWSSYYDSAHAVVYVVDGDNTDAAYWSDAAQQYSAMAAHPLNARKPVLVLANHRTTAAATPAAAAGLQQLSAAAESEQVRVVHGVVVGDGSGEVKAALGWLVARVDAVYDGLDGRVKADVDERKQRMKEERERRREQLEREKEEREKVEAQARQADEHESGWNALAVSGPNTGRSKVGNDESGDKQVEEEKTAE